MIDWRSKLRHYFQRKRLWSTIIGGGLAAGLLLGTIYFIFWKDTSGPSFGDVIARIGPGMFATTSAMYIVALVFAVIGWGWIIGTFSGNWQWFQHWRIYSITAVTRRLPGALWYMLGRIMLYERLQVARSLTVLSSGIEFAALIFGGLLVTIITWPIVLIDRSIHPLWLLLGLLLGVILLNPMALRWALRRLSPQHATVHVSYRHLLGWSMLYAVIWCVGGGMLFALTTTIHPVSLSLLPVVIGVWTTAGLVATVLSFVPLGLGSDLTIVALLSAYISSSEALAIALLMRAVLMINEVVWAAIAALLSLTGFFPDTQTPVSTIFISPDHEAHSDG